MRSSPQDGGLVCVPNACTVWFCSTYATFGFAATRAACAALARSSKPRSAVRVGADHAAAVPAGQRRGVAVDRGPGDRAVLEHDDVAVGDGGVAAGVQDRSGRFGGGRGGGERERGQGTDPDQDGLARESHLPPPLRSANRPSRS